MNFLLKFISLDTFFGYVLKLAGIATEVWSHAKTGVVAAEQSGGSGEIKHKWVTNALSTLFPQLSPQWIQFIVQAAWFVIDRLGYKLPTQEADKS